MVSQATGRPTAGRQARKEEEIIIIKIMVAEQGRADSKENATTATSQATRKRISGTSQAMSIRDPPNLGVKPRAAQEMLVAPITVLKS